jgi:hypothetical protein
MNRCILILVSIFLSSTSARAGYFTANLATPYADKARGTHVIVVGKGLEVGDQWLRTAHTQALIYKDRKGQGSIRVIGAIENKDYAKMLSTWGYTNLVATKEAMTAKRLLIELGKIAKIESIDFIGHNGALLGFMLEDAANRFYVSDAKLLEKIKDRFASDAVIRLYGCNTGWFLAPAIANATGVPTSGSFTYADLQRLHENGDWFYHDAGRFPPGSFTSENPLSYKDKVDCKFSGGCMRLRVVNSPYQGKHGSYAGTLPFMKFFCGGLLSQAECFRRMAVSTTTTISVAAFDRKPSLDEFSKDLIDQFCPSFVNEARRSACKKEIADHLNGKQTLPPQYNTSTETAMRCTFTSCEQEKNCKNGSCVVQAKHKGQSKTFVNELNAYLAGYALWR